MHNGIVSNYRELAIKYNLKLKSECDSEVLLRLVEREREPAAGLRRCLREITGSAAIALHDRRTGLVWLARNNGRPLWMMRLLDDRRVFLASTAEILLTALRIVLGPRVTRSIQFMMPLPEGTPVALSATGLMVAPTVALE